MSYFPRCLCTPAVQACRCCGQSHQRYRPL